MKSRRFTIIAVTALAALGGGAAVAATQNDEAKEREDAILGDAAERLDVGTDELRSALSEARLAEIDRAVEEGKLTQEQADRIKEHVEESGLVLGGPGPHGPGGPPPFLDDVAEELGISVEKLRQELHSGKTLREVAKEHGKSMADLRKLLPERPPFHRGGHPMGGPRMGPPPGFGQ